MRGRASPIRIPPVNAPRDPSTRSSASTRTAEDLVDAATGLDGRAWITLRDLLRQPWEMIRRAAFEGDPHYVGAVKLSLAMSTLAIVLMSWLMEPDAYLQAMRAADPVAWGRFEGELASRGVCMDHFADRFWSRHELINTVATLLECGVFALLLWAFDRRRPYLSHLSFALYGYTLWLMVTVPLQFALAADLPPAVVFWVGIGMVVLLPGLMIAGLLRLYPASWPRQLLRALLLVVTTALLFVLAAAAISAGAMAWARASFGL